MRFDRRSRAEHVQREAESVGGFSSTDGLSVLLHTFYKRVYEQVSQMVQGSQPVARGLHRALRPRCVSSQLRFGIGPK